MHYHCQTCSHIVCVRVVDKVSPSLKIETKRPGQCIGKVKNRSLTYQPLFNSSVKIIRLVRIGRIPEWGRKTQSVADQESFVQNMLTDSDYRKPIKNG